MIYEDKDAAILCQMSYSGKLDVKDNGNGGILSWFPEANLYVFAIRGTEFDFEDIIRDMRAMPWRDPDLGWCHRGFLTGGRSLYKKLKMAVPFMTKKSKLIITGHSLGGALANIIAAKLLIEDNYKVEKLITFGCPRTGFSKLGKVLEPITQSRYVNGDDLVPRHPYPFWGYRHTTDQIDLTPKEEHRFKNHRIQEYINQL